MKRTVRLTEADLHNIIKQCVNEALNENNVDEAWYNNRKDFKNGLKKAARVGALTAGMAAAGAGGIKACADGIDNAIEHSDNMNRRAYDDYSKEQFYLNHGTDPFDKDIDESISRVVKNVIKEHFENR